MAFQQLNKDVLFIVAHEFGVELPASNINDMTKNEMIKALDDEGVTWTMYKEAFPDVEEEEEKEEEATEAVADEEKSDAAAEFKAAPQKVLVKMTRGNGTFQVRGYTFTRAHPFLPVTADDAEYLVNEMEGFSIATPREAEEFYS